MEAILLAMEEEGQRQTAHLPANRCCEKGPQVRCL